MIAWSSSTEIHRPPEVVFHFLANIQDVKQEEGSPVLELELITPGPPGLGSRYREVVRMLPFFKGEILSEITAFEPPRVLEMTWRAPGMKGTDTYELAASHGGTTLKHTKNTACLGPLRLVEPLMRAALVPRLEDRLLAIKRETEALTTPSPAGGREARDVSASH
jgi:uncharacterized protein YndB with AHSA1/START domain